MPPSSQPADNPYLAHRKLDGKVASGASRSAPDPLEGLVPRFVTAKQARDVIVSHPTLCGPVEC